MVDSEGDNGDVELEDEDSVGDDQRYHHSSSGNLSSFKRGGPALAGDRRAGGSRSRSRGGETRKVKGDKEKHKVGQLDERNLKKAANRYGTLPKVMISSVFSLVMSILCSDWSIYNTVISLVHVCKYCVLIVPSKVYLVCSYWSL